MKKIILIAIVALSIASCRKERTCECKTTSTEVITGFGAQTTTSNAASKVTVEKQKKNHFKYAQECFSQQYSYPDSGGNGANAWSSETTVVRECEIN